MIHIFEAFATLPLSIAPLLSFPSSLPSLPPSPSPLSPYRANTFGGTALAWSNLLAVEAQQWASWQLNITCAEPLSPTHTYGTTAVPRPTTGSQNGQTMFVASFQGTAARDPFPASLVVQQWIDEKSS